MKMQRGQKRQRFSPARAGNSQGYPGHSWSDAVQPRACGELILVSSGGAFPTGSAPRVRGTPYCPLPVTVSRRFSPARAGNSLSVSHRTRIFAVQPRACGELLGRG